ncbi:MAG TPA: D-aminoacyl-tRNA deacylase [Edaphocola sp.]|nr:D-aminoacyl-tRNA deacylase [Edaphocola sp.]
MKAVIQRVSQCRLSIGGIGHSVIRQGLLVLIGIAAGDTGKDMHWLCRKISQMRLFADGEGKMNLSVKDINGDIMLVSQFTLLADARKGNRPSYIRAARPETAIPLYEAMVRQLSEALGKPVATGVFGADMQITLTNDGPVTIILDSREGTAG